MGWKTLAGAKGGAEVAKCWGTVAEVKRARDDGSAGLLNTVAPNFKKPWQKVK